MMVRCLPSCALQLPSSILDLHSRGCLKPACTMASIIYDPLAFKQLNIIFHLSHIFHLSTEFLSPHPVARMPVLRVRTKRHAACAYCAPRGGVSA